MIAVATLLIVLLLSLIMVRVAAEALILTGLSRESASFQARSAWTGTGFTTSESEQVVAHPVRRRIISTLMFLRSAGLVTAASTLMLSFVNVEEQGSGLLRIAVLIVGAACLWLFARSRWISIWMSRVIAYALKRYTDLDTRDYAGLLHLAGEYAVMELGVKEKSWMTDRSLGDLRLPDEGVLVLGVVRPDTTYLGAPRADTVVRSGDNLVLYGRSSTLSALARRKPGAAGDEDRNAAVAVEEMIETQDRKAGGSAEK
ncbi:MAG TPA: TrkA C-terminal domain-containing protein [Devosiaceae bacterium]|jgi:hypothetical protein|nr:TrkA C-terminal domain-containing protein [Devosiaceae bacterium]